MSTRIVCVDPNAVGPYAREIETGQTAQLGDEIEVTDAALAENLLTQEAVWAKPSTKAATEAQKAAKARRRLDGGDVASDDSAAPAAETQEA